MGNVYSFIQFHELVKEFIQSIYGQPDHVEDLDTTQTSTDDSHPQKLVVLEDANPERDVDRRSVMPDFQSGGEGFGRTLKASEDILSADQVQLDIVDTSALKKYPISPNFEFIPCEHKRRMLESAYNTITRLQKWDYLCEYKVSEETGYMFSTESTINELMDQINTDYQSNHSGFSISYTMRSMDLIAKNGFDSFRESIVQNTVSKCSETAETADSSVVLDNWLHLNNKIQKLNETVTENNDEEEMPALEPVSDDEDEMPALEPVSDDDDDDDEMPPLIPSPQMFPSDPSFDFMKLYKHEAESAYQTVQNMEMWNYLHNYTTDETRGYMFSEDPKIIELMQQIQRDYGGLHSGSSMALTMRFMELIANEGFDVFREECIRQRM